MIDTMFINLFLVFFSLSAIVLIIFLIDWRRNMNTGLQNLNTNIAALKAQQLLTVSAIQNIQSTSGDSDTAVQAAADAVATVTAALAAATPTPTAPVPTP